MPQAVEGATCHKVLDQVHLYYGWLNLLPKPLPYLKETATYSCRPADCDYLETHPGFRRDDLGCGGRCCARRRRPLRQKCFIL